MTGFSKTSLVMIAALIVEFVFALFVHLVASGQAAVGNAHLALLSAAVVNVIVMAVCFLFLRNSLQTSKQTDNSSSALFNSQRRLSSVSEALAHERSILENAADVICQLDRDGRFTRISQASVRMFGFDPEELKGRWLIEIISDDTIPETTRALKLAVEQRIMLPFENRVMRKDGLPIQVLWSVYWSEKDQCLVCVAHEITERKDAEMRLRVSEARTRSILENIPIGIAILDQAGNVQAANPALEGLLGLSFAEIRRINFTQLFVESDKLSHSVLMRELLSRPEHLANRFQLRRHSAESLPVEVSMTNFDSIDDKRFLALITDVTERFQIEKMKREFIALVTHELRTPLTSLQGFLAMLGGGVYGDMPELAQKKTQTVNRTIDRLIELINDILDIEKMEAGMFDFNFQPTSLTDVVERSVESVREMAGMRNVSIAVKIAEASIYADGDRLIQVLVNLLSNAIKYSGQGTTVSLELRDLGDWLELRIQDRGKGIADQYKELIFERFLQVPGFDGTTFKSTGLGLPICKAIVQQHGGTIGVESEEGQGSCFWFRLKKETALTKQP